MRIRIRVSCEVTLIEHIEIKAILGNVDQCAGISRNLLVSKQIMNEFFYNLGHWPV